MNRFEKILCMGCHFLFLLCNLGYAQVDTRLTYVSNDYDTPSKGVGTLIIDVEARTTILSSSGISVFQNALQLDANLIQQNPIVDFTNQQFPESNYNINEDYRSSDGRIRYVYAFSSGARSIVNNNWRRLLTLTIQYTMSSTTASIAWFNGLPNYLVTDENNINITGIEEQIPSELNNIPLPITERNTQSEIPTRYSLYQNYPNPFNPTTTLRFDIPSTGAELVDTKLIIYNSLGQSIKKLYNENLSAGSYEIQWDGTNDFGKSAPTGIYFALFRADGFTQLRKLVLIK